LLGYRLYADLKVSEVAALFQADPVSLLAANSVDFSVPDVENRILPSGLFLRVPAACSCSGGIRRSLSTRYTVRPADTLSSIAASVYGGLASPDQIQEANNIQDPSALDAGRTLVIPLPCTCFNSSDNFLPAVYLSYVVRQGDSVPAVAARYSTTVTDIMNVNNMGSPSIQQGDILAIPLPVSCSSMQCSNSSLMLGNYTSQQTAAGCSVTSCNYGGFVNGSIVTRLSASLQPRCPDEATEKYKRLLLLFHVIFCG
ncbi:hypothetical protein BHE74_00058980, partial [Ensete ventricosum]